ncbi:Protease 4 [Mannheimia haemolytica]|uniref:Protease 4 n=1 Tax=Mannheimia haemolytica TaxID=75985 RepID=A0A378MWF6_MANHA|nr:Protease 4 [Mannheimia haemolytica]
MKNINKLKENDAQLALNQKWVSQLVSSQESRDKLIAQFGKNSEGSYNQIEFLDYMTELNDRFAEVNAPKIAVVNVEGRLLAVKVTK